jgi:hypothetical protein
LAAGIEALVRYYLVTHERAGEIVARVAIHANDEADAIVRANTSFDALPEHDPRGDGVEPHAGLPVRSAGGFEVLRAREEFDA